MDDFTFMSMGERRDALLGLARDPNATLGAIGLEPAEEPLFVLSTDDGVIAGTHTQCLMAAAESLGMVVMEPMLVQGKDDAPDTYEVWADMGGTATRLASAATDAEALDILRANLEMLAGNMALPLADWLELQSSDPFTESETKKRRGAQWAHLVVVGLVGKVLADGWIGWELDLPAEATKVRHRQAREQLLKTDGLHFVKKTKALTRFEIAAVELDGDLYANFHDLSRAARKGVDVSKLRPWPYFGANAFVINREYQRQLRAAGWRMLWSGEQAPAKRASRDAAGATWVRAEPTANRARTRVSGTSAAIATTA